MAFNFYITLDAGVPFQMATTAISTILLAIGTWIAYINLRRGWPQAWHAKGDSQDNGGLKVTVQIEHFWDHRITVDRLLVNGKKQEMEKTIKLLGKGKHGGKTYVTIPEGKEGNATYDVKWRWNEKFTLVVKY